MNLDQAVEILKEKNKREARKKQIEAVRDSLLDFICMMNPKYQVNWHHKAICDRLSSLKYETGKKIMLFVGPQRGKSEIVSRNFPAWWLGNFPSSKNILSSYSGSLANSFNRDAQDIMSQPEYLEIFPNTITGAFDKSLKSTQNECQTSSKGYLFSVGVGGSTTGRAAGEISSGKEDNVSPGVFICDDPVKDLAEAFSETFRRRKMDWWQSVVNTRIHGTSHTILMHTRWHQLDVAGQILADGADGWEIISFPELGPDKEYKNEYDPRVGENEPLWPEEKGGYDELMKVKETVGSYTFSALFQQKPKVQGGNIIKEEWIRLYQKPPSDPHKLKSINMLQSWDLQFKKTGSSYTVGITLGRYGADYYLLDIYRQKADVVDTKRAIKDMSNSWSNCLTILVEDKANGPAILSMLGKTVQGLIPVSPDSSKDERLHSVSPIFEAGNFHIPANHPETKNIIDELTTFPASANDDIVDAISQGINRFQELRGLAALQAYR